MVRRIGVGGRHVGAGHRDEPSARLVNRGGGGIACTSRRPKGRFLGRAGDRDVRVEDTAKIQSAEQKKQQNGKDEDEFDERLAASAYS